MQGQPPSAASACQEGMSSAQIPTASVSRAPQPSGTSALSHMCFQIEEKKASQRVKCPARLRLLCAQRLMHPCQCQLLRCVLVITSWHSMCVHCLPPLSGISNQDSGLELSAGKVSYSEKAMLKGSAVPVWLSCLQGRQLSGEQGYSSSLPYPASLALQPHMYRAELHCMAPPSVSAQQKSRSQHES